MMTMITMTNGVKNQALKPAPRGVKLNLFKVSQHKIINFKPLMLLGTVKGPFVPLPTERQTL